MHDRQASPRVKFEKVNCGTSRHKKRTQQTLRPSKNLPDLVATLCLSLHRPQAAQQRYSGKSQHSNQEQSQR
jgi:hypothetical protein